MKNKLYVKSKNRVVDLSCYSGKWVAFVDNRPVISEKDLHALMQKVKKHCFPKEPSIMLVPRKDEGPYVLLLL